MTKDRLRCENIGYVFHTSIKRGCHLNGDPFFVSEYYRKVCIKSRKLGLKIAKFS